VSTVESGWLHSFEVTAKCAHLNATFKAAMGLELIGKFKLLLGMLAMLGCLLAATQLHAHEAGLHDIDHACISCDLEDVLSHGAVPALLFSLNAQPAESVITAYITHAYTVSQSFSSIRAPPLHS